MITRMLAVLLATVLTPLAPTLAMGADDAEVRRELEQQYQKLVEAHGEDPKTIAGLLTADFHGITSDGRIHDLRAEKQIYEETHWERAQYTIRELAVSENRLIAVVEVFREITRSRTLAGAPRKLEFRCMKRDTWSRTRKGWRLKSVDHIRDEKKYVDGKRVDPTKPFDPDAPPYEPAAVLAPLAPQAIGPDDAEVRRELEQQYQKLVEAHGLQDRKASARLMTADFHAILPDGRVLDVRAAKEMIDAVLESKMPARLGYTIREVAVSENRLIAVVEVFREMSWMSKLAGTPRKVSTTDMRRSTWSRTRKGWKLKSVDHIRDEKRFVGGKRVDPAKPFDPDAPPYESAEEGKD